MLLFFSVARSAHTSQAERAKEATSETPGGEAITGIELPADTHEKMPTDKLLDVSAFALRMSSPFNSGYWLAAA
jgi:hypothetical protein